MLEMIDAYSVDSSQFKDKIFCNFSFETKLFQIFKAEKQSKSTLKKD